MRGKQLWAHGLGLEKTVVEEVYVDDTSALVCQVRPRAREQLRCPRCRRRCGRYDAGEGYRYWRGLDVGAVCVYIEAESPRVRCPKHGVIVAAVPWARHASRFTRNFEDQTAWLATHTDKTSASELMRTSWRSVGRIVGRVGDEGRRATDLLVGLRRIGVDEVSYRKRHKYITVVVDHDTGRLVWAAEGRSRATLDRFFTELGPERCADIALVSADAAAWISGPVKDHCPNAVRCMDPFHVVQWATDALDTVRAELWHRLRRSGDVAGGRALKRSRFALWKNPDTLTAKQEQTLASIQRTNRPLYRAYLLKEHLRAVFHTESPDDAKHLLAAWLAWAQRCRLPAFVKLGRRIRRHREAIMAAVLNRLSNARTEGMNTRIRLITRLAYGFHSAEALIGLAMLKLAGICPALPGRIRAK